MFVTFLAIEKKNYYFVNLKLFSLIFYFLTLISKKKKKKHKLERVELLENNFLFRTLEFHERKHPVE